MKMHRQYTWTSSSRIASLTATALIAAVFIGGAGQAWAVSPRDGPPATEELQSQAMHGKEEYGPVHREISAARESDISNDATLSSLALVADSEPIELLPAFDPDFTFYTTTVTAEDVIVEAVTTKDTASIVSFTVGDKTEAPESDDDKLTTRVQIPAGAITDLSLTVKAEDGASTRTYFVLASRGSSQMLPEIAIEADRSEYVAGLGSLSFTLGRTGDTSSELEVTLNLIQDQAWLSSTSHAVTFAAGESTSTLTFWRLAFSSDVTQSGALIATVAPVSGYDTSGATVSVSVISQEGPAVTVSFEETEYTVAEGADSLGAILVARAAPAVPYVESFEVSVSSDALEASSPADYVAYSAEITFVPTDFAEVDGSLVGKVAAVLTILDDEIPEEDERFGLELARAASTPAEVNLLDPNGVFCDAICRNHYLVTIVDDDGPVVSVSYEQAAYPVAEGGSATIKVVLSADPERGIIVPITVTEQGGATFSDYRDVYSWVEFHPGDIAKSFIVTAVQDFDNDDGESVRLGFGELPAGVTAGMPSETTVSIIDDDEGDPAFNVGTLGAFWIHIDDADGNLLPIGDCAGSGSFRIIWGAREDRRGADEWDARITTYRGMSAVSYGFRESAGLPPGHYEMNGTVNIEGEGNLHIRVRGRYDDIWGTWSPPVGLYCLERLNEDS